MDSFSLLQIGLLVVFVAVIYIAYIVSTNMYTSRCPRCKSKNYNEHVEIFYYKGTPYNAVYRTCKECGNTWHVRTS